MRLILQYEFWTCVQKIASQGTPSCHYTSTNNHQHYDLTASRVQLAVALCHKTGGSGGWFPVRSLETFNWPILLSAFNSPGVYSASNRNKYQGTSLAIQCRRRVELKLCRPSCAECQSNDGRPTFHSPSEPSWFVMGKLYLLLWPHQDLLHKMNT